VRLVETAVGLATGLLFGGLVGLGVVDEIDPTGSHPTRNLALVLLLAAAGALVAALAYVPKPARPRDRSAHVAISDALANPLVDPAVHRDEDRVRAYAVTLDLAPPPVLFDTGDALVLADGYHRVAAAQHRGATSIRPDIRQGTREDALHYAATTIAREQGISIEEALEAIRRRQTESLDAAPPDDPLPYSADGYQS
jgi:hypothetical protein